MDIHRQPQRGSLVEDQTTTTPPTTTTTTTATATTNANNKQHLSVMRSANSNSLMRGNSVVTLNQIYQHHNSIPVRNRILYQAKSLQQPSIDQVDYDHQGNQALEQQLQATRMHANSQPPASSSTGPLMSQSISNSTTNKIVLSQNRQQAAYQQQQQQQQLFHNPLASSQLIHPMSGQSALAAPPANNTMSNVKKVAVNYSPPVRVINVARRHRHQKRPSQQQQPPPQQPLSSVYLSAQPTQNTCSWSTNDSTSNSSTCSSSGTSPIHLQHQRQAANLTPIQLLGASCTPSSQSMSTAASSTTMSSSSSHHKQQQQLMACLPSKSSSIQSQEHIQQHHHQHQHHHQQKPPNQTSPSHQIQATTTERSLQQQQQQQAANPLGASPARTCSSSLSSTITSTTTTTNSTTRRILPQPNANSLAQTGNNQCPGQETMSNDQHQRDSLESSNLNSSSTKSTALTTTTTTKKQLTSNDQLGAELSQPVATLSRTTSVKQQRKLPQIPLTGSNTTGGGSSGAAGNQRQYQRQMTTTGVMVAPAEQVVAANASSLGANKSTWCSASRWHQQLQQQQHQQHQHRQLAQAKANSTSSSCSSSSSSSSSAAANCSSSASQSVASSMQQLASQYQSPIHRHPQQPPATAAKALPHQPNSSLVSQQLRVQSFPMPSSSPTHQHASPFSTSTTTTTTTNNLSNNSSTNNSLDTPSPRSPAVRGAQAAVASAGPKLSASSSSSGSALKSPALQQSAGGFFTFDQQQQQPTVEVSSMACRSPCLSPAPRRLPEEPVQGDKQQHLAASLGDPNGGPNIRGRRLSSCGSGLRANFLMNKQHAISEHFTPPRSLESSHSRGSAEAWPGAGQSALEAPTTVNQNYGDNIDNNNNLTSGQFDDKQTDANELVRGQQLFFSATAANGQHQQQSTRSNYQLFAANVTSVSSTHLRRPSGAAYGLPPRAASASETSNGAHQHHQPGMDNLLLCASRPAGESSGASAGHRSEANFAGIGSFTAGNGYMNASSAGEVNMLSTAAGNLLGMKQNPATRSMTAVVPTQLCTSRPGQPIGGQLASNQHLYEPGVGATIVAFQSQWPSVGHQQPRPQSQHNSPARLACPPAPNLANMPAALSVDVYQCNEFTPTSTGALGATNELAGSTNSDLEPMSWRGSTNLLAGSGQAGSQFLARPMFTTQRSSLTIPPSQRDRQPSNVSTASMPIGSAGGQLYQLLGQANSSNTNTNTTANPATQTSAQPAAPVRKFGAWAERIAAAASSSLSAAPANEADRRRARSASQLVDSAHEEGANRRPDGSVRCQLSRSTSSSSSGGDDAEQMILDATSGSSLSGRPSCSSSSKTTTSGDESDHRTHQRRSISVRRQDSKRMKRRLSVGQRARSNTAKASDRQEVNSNELSRRRQARKGDNVAKEHDQLTLNDRLKLAELSASKLFRKVELSPLKQSTNAGGHLHNVHKSTGIRANERAHRSHLGEWQDRDDKHGGRRSATDQLGRHKEATTKGDSNNDEQGDDLSLFLRQVDKQRRSATASGGQLDDQSNQQRATTNQSGQPAGSTGDQGQGQARAKSALGAMSLERTSSAAKALRRAMTLRSLVRNFSRRTSSCDEAAVRRRNLNLNSNSATPGAPLAGHHSVGVSKRPSEDQCESSAGANNCSHLLSVASADVKRQQRRSADCLLSQSDRSFSSGAAGSSASAPAPASASASTTASVAPPIGQQLQEQVSRGPLATSNSSSPRRDMSAAAVKRRAVSIFRRSKGSSSCTTTASLGAPSCPPAGNSLDSLGPAETLATTTTSTPGQTLMGRQQLATTNNNNNNKATMDADAGVEGRPTRAPLQSQPSSQLNRMKGGKF